jgi:predicted ATPase/transcriptional regulator with XRE-family HTH domain
VVSGTEGDRPALFGELLRRHRAAAGFTQEELAERAGLSVRGLRYLERGLHRPYRDTVQRLLEVLALSPEDHRLLVEAARPRAVSAMAGEHRGGGLPVPPSPLIGRERDVAAVADLLHRAEVRVVTLTGPGGVGKTRLALEVAANLQSAFDGGVLWVPLAAVTDPTLVASAVTQALGLTETGALPAQDALTIALRDRTVLLLLDNFEHVAAAAGLVSDLVAGCPQVRVLITSRAALRLRSEHEFFVAPLPAPEVTQRLSVQALAANPAVDLFLRRAQAVKPDFTLTGDNGAAVAAICRRLEGLPLALELAAPRIRVLPPPAMLARLEHRLTFLTGGALDSPARQRTMRETIAWSYDLLTPRERKLLRSVAIFEGGCSLPAIEELCDPTDGSPEPTAFVDLLGTVESLQRNSLLLQEEAAPAEEPRFRMLETVREYGLERLAASGAEDELRQRYVDYFLASAEEAARGFFSPATAFWLDRVETDHANLRAAMRWCLEHEDAERGLRLAAALWSFWYVRGYATEGRALLAALLALPEAATASRARAQALLGAGQLALTQGDHAAAWASLQESITLHRLIGEEKGTADALLAAGFVARLQEEYQTATALLNQGLALARATGNIFIAAACLHHLGMIAGDVDHDNSAARRLLGESLVLYRSLGFPRFIALVLLSLGTVALAEADLDRAHDMLQQSLTGMKQVGEKLGIHGALDTFGHLAITRGQTERAVRLAGAADRLRATSGTHSWPVVQRTRTRWLASARQTLDETAYQAAWEQGHTMNREEAIAYALEETPWPPYSSPTRPSPAPPSTTPAPPQQSPLTEPDETPE